MDFDFSKLEFYILVSNDKFFRTKGYNGHGESWVDDIKRARVWTKIGPARSAQTIFSEEKYLEAGFPIPTIVKLTPLGYEMIDDHNRIRINKLKKLKDQKYNFERSLKNQHSYIDSMKANPKHDSESKIKNIEYYINQLEEKIVEVDLKLRALQF